MSNQAADFYAEQEYRERTGKDNVNHPAHYTAGGIECIDAIEAATEGLAGIVAVCAGNAIKYIWRFSRKNGTEDIDKAIWYLNRLKKALNERNPQREEYKG